MVMTFLITSFGTLDLAAYGVGSNVLQVVMIPAMGLSMAVSTLVGQNIGAGNIERAAAIGRLGALIGFSDPDGVRPARLPVRAQLVAFFVPNDAAVIAAGAVFLRIMALSPGASSACSSSLTGVLRASGNMVVTMVLTLVSQWVLQFPLAYVLSQAHALDVHGIWWAFPITELHDRADHPRRLRQRRLEEEAPARRGGGADHQGQRRHPERRAAPLARSCFSSNRPWREFHRSPLGCGPVGCRWHKGFGPGVHEFTDPGPREKNTFIGARPLPWRSEVMSATGVARSDEHHHARDTA